MIESVSIGAIGAAAIGALISLITLIVSKEQKVSDFRQEWINELRREFVIYITQINIVADHSNMEFKSINEKIEKLHPLYSKLNEANFAISLRINDKEKYAKDVKLAMSDLYILINNSDKVNTDQLRPIEDRFLSSSKNLLKYEWERVKRGEPVFRVARNILILLIVIFSIASFLVFYNSYFTSNAVQDAISLFKDSFFYLKNFIH